jgi:plasmid maintenance system killer protein
LIILFEDPNFRDECNDNKLLKRCQGDLRAKKIRQRLDDLKAASDLSAMKSLPGRCHELKGDHHGQLSLDLDHPWRLIFKPADIPPALKPDGGMDWANVHVINILGIKDTHD